MANEFSERYARQQLINNWDQKKLSSATVVVIGAGLLGEFVNLGLAALGVGEIRIVTSERNGKKDNGVLGKLKKYTKYNGDEKAKIFANVLKKLNPTIQVIDIHTELFTENYFVLFNSPKIVIDTTNDQQSKLMCQKYCKENKTTFVSCCSNDVYGLVDVNPDEAKLSEHFKFEDKEQGSIVSEVLAGFVIDEVRKVLMPLNQNDKTVKKTLKYNLIDKERF